MQYLHSFKQALIHFSLTVTLVASNFSVADSHLPDTANGEEATSDLAYSSYVHSNNRFKCLYGYAAEKTGDHVSAMAIFNDCIERWNDVYSMIWLAQMYEAGVSVPKDLKRSTALMKRGAHVEAEDDEAGYATLARYHYGVALYEGIGTDMNKLEARHWLNRAAAEGLPDAKHYLKNLTDQ